MKWSFLLFSSFLCLQAIAQYPATGNKARLGWQTTGDGLVYRGAIGDTATLDPSGLNNAWMLLDTANGNLYAYRAKAWRLVSGGGGSVSDTLTGEVKGPLDSTYIDTVANIIFTTTTDTTVGVGELEYNDTQGSLIQGLKGGNVTNVIGQQIHQRVTNATGAPLTKGTAVFLHGSQGNRITVRKALATADSTSANTFGIVAESIANNQSGYVITEGLITNMNTNALTEGAAVYLSPTVAGELTTTKPQAPQHTVYIGVCVKQHTGSGELFVKIRNGQELDELHDVRIDSPASNASLYYNSSESVWRDTTGAVLTSDTSVFARDFQISGTTNRLAMFTGSNAVGNSVVDVTSDTVSIRDYSNSYTTWRFHSNINKRGFIGYPSGTRFYSLVNPSVYAGFMYGDRSAGAQDQQAFTQLTAWNGGGAAGGFFSAATTLNGADSTLYFNISGLSANANPTFPAAQMVIQKGGNVGIATSSPSRPLHVNANSSMIIPSGATGTRPASGAEGDIRYNTTNANFEWYSGTGWREPVNAARSPNTVGITNRFSKFDANGLLDTSAVLVQANGRIGIWNSPAASDSVLTVTGGIRATTGVRATQLNVNTSGTQVLSINNYSGNANVSPNNVFIGNGGQSATGSGTQGRNNIGIGTNALLSITVGEGSIGIGTNAMATRADTMQSNIAIGGGAMQFQGSAKNNDNTAIGTNALRYNRGGNYNVALGSNALTQNTAIPNSDNAGGTLQGGSNNFGLGFQSCYWNGTGLQNVGIGSSANYANRNGSYNIAIGGQALAGGTSAADTAAKSNNVAIGANSLEFLKGNGAGNSDENVAIGYHAGRSYGSGAGTNFTAGKTSVYIGAYTRANANTNENEIAIGYGTIGNGSNTTTISNGSTTHNVFQYGEMLFGYAKSADVGDYRVQVNGNGYVSGEFRIGYTADQGAYPLQVNGQIFATNATIATSDARLKQDIEPLKSGLKEVLSLNPVTYTFKPDTINNYPKGKQVGFLAQEIKATVQGDYAGSIVQEAGGYLGVADTKLIPLLVKAIQEQQAQIEALKKEIEALKNK